MTVPIVPTVPVVPVVSVVLPTSTSEGTIGAQLDALAGQLDAPPFEVVVVANRCTYPVDEVVRRHAPHVARVVRADERAGVAYARNAGVAATCAARLLFVDDDDVVDRRYVATMAAALDSARAVAARIETVSLNPGWRSSVRDLAQSFALPTTPWPWAYGCSLGVDRRVVDEVGPFAEDLPAMAGEDIEWCGRLQRAGIALRFVPDAVVAYRFRTAIRASWRQGFAYGRSGEAIAPAWPGTLGWVRSLAGPVRRAALGPGPGWRRRGTFLLGRRVGQVVTRVRSARTAGTAAGGGSTAAGRTSP